MSLPGGPEPVEVYESVAARNAALSTPRVGQCAITLDDGAMSVYYGKYLGWRPPWSIGWGEQQYAEITTGSATFPSDLSELAIAGLSVTITPVVGRQYLTEFDGGLSSGADTDFLTLYILTSRFEFAGCGTNTLHFASASKRMTMTGFAPDLVRFGKRWTATSNVAHTFYVAGRQGTGSGGQVAANACGVSAIRVVDVGPASAPVIT